MTQSPHLEPIAHKLTEFFQTHLPITDYMEMSVEHYDGQTLTLKAPLLPNINDKQTGFGGSLYNMAVMACWGMAYLKTQEAAIACNQVVAKGAIEYKAPVTGEIRATCHVADLSLTDRFISDFKAKGKARINLESNIQCNGKQAVEFHGQYAIFKPL